MVDTIIEFDRPRISPSIIMVAGVGGGGSNAVNHMFEMGIADVSFMVCNTDRQALYRSPVGIKVRLGEHLTQGLGAGNNPERGREAALESQEEITEIFKREGTKMVFITAGMGGGTGTGAAPVIARIAKELDILTVAIVTLPFKTEGPKRMNHAYQGIDELKQYVDALLLINNENIQEIYGKLTLSEAFGMADDILATAAKSIAEVITRESTVNVDFADVQTVMKESGIALMGSGRASGENRAMVVADAALSSPLLNHNDIIGARNILINITSGSEEITLEETYLITEYIQARSGNNADIIWGAGNDPALGDEIEVTIIATGFEIEQGNGQYDRVISSPLQTQLHAARHQQGATNETQPEATTLAPNTNMPSTPKVPTPHTPVWSSGRTTTPGIPPRTPPFGGTTPQGGSPLSVNTPQGSNIGMPNSSSSATTPLVPGSRPNAHNPLMDRPISTPVLESKNANVDSGFNVEEMENMPAYVRRNMKFIKDNVDEGGRSSRVVLKDDAAPAPAESNPSSLFD